MATPRLPCRIRVRKANSNNADSVQAQKSAVFAVGDCPEIGIEIRKRWAQEVMKMFGGPYISIRPWDLLAELDGSVFKVDSYFSKVDGTVEIPGSIGKAYPARFQIPPSCLRELEYSERVRRSEMFAMASLLYEIMSGKQPFEGLTDEEVQDRFVNGDFPSDASTLPNSLFIFSGWSEEFSNELAKQGMMSRRRALQSVDAS